ncbi:3-deoxy-manno-octulosonate cytidylyltransferase (CMP-KDO synthetase) [Nonlabens xylanidelens]|uniref:3-deoxy-manno-octulosonate cytidylyltransferase n=1 Tax=Nonlabens xylanidelens TaxID=191564 RepID=A0A2S6IGK6_9FLAO|nr:3-deoxy-manno-octulosonate cytidylyltransferase [Nonlabens xylanidelens]PPK93354.1 3-deoxy-manno-octulosonate cytidylyltransferase (CMP-KDO synthetase) [Nonlabens xylanidelens]PQJ20834.1 3-deoxy-D-manno-octulosonate cytidylyltransferase [Nonlabens xylanidelens]PQJ22698.1 3-deoxy-D-manno-octulosonate cytidylyltransferase [Nonlabens xylanidelens]
MKKIAVIPARFEASRFPGKLMKDLCGKTVIMRTYEAALHTGLFDQVLVATDSDVIYNEIISNGGEAVMSQKNHETGSDRIAEAVESYEADIVINVQGDEPFTNQTDLKKLIAVFENDKDQEISLASLMHEITEIEDIENPNNVKVITDLNSNALYFSRSVIPFPRDKAVKEPVYKHIGIYAFRKSALLDFYNQSPTPLELSEKIECIRYLEHGKKIKMIPTSHLSIGIDVPEDLEKARLEWQRLH